MEFILGILIEWLALNANIDISNKPAIAIEKPAQLHQKFGGPVHALYDHKKEIIYLADDIDLATLEGASILLHELVHHYQKVSGALDSYSCIRASEKLAYETQRQFLLANNADLMPELNEFNILMRSMCDDIPM